MTDDTQPNEGAAAEEPTEATAEPATEAAEAAEATEPPTEATEPTQASEPPTESAEAPTEVVAAESVQAAAPVEPAEPAEPKKHLKNGVPRWKRALAVVLLVIGFVLVPLSAVSIWSRNQLLNTDRYVHTVEPLADNPDIQKVVATRAVDALFSSVDVSSKIEGALPKRAKFLGDTIASQAQGYAVQVTEKLLASSQFEKLWDNMNRIAHAQLVAVLKDQNGATAGPAKLKDGKITLDISQTIETVKTELTKKGLGFLKNVSVPPVKRTIVLIDAGGIDQARTASKILNAVAWLLPILAIGCFVAAALLVRPRRRGTIRSGLVLFGASAFTLVLLAVGRYFYLDAATPPGGNGKAAAAVWDILLRNLRLAVIILGIIGLLIAFVAWLFGSSGGAERIRAMASRGVGGLRRVADEHGYTPGPVAEWVTANKRGLQIGAIVLAVLVFIAWTNPTIGVTLVILIVLALVLGAISFLTRGSAAPAEGTTSDDGAESEPEDAAV